MKNFLSFFNIRKRIVSTTVLFTYYVIIATCIVISLWAFKSAFYAMLFVGYVFFTEKPAVPIEYEKED